MPSRRRILASLGSVIAVALAGCSGSDTRSLDTTDCRGHALAHGDGDVLDGGVMATIEGDDVRLAIPLSVETVRDQDVQRVTISDVSGDLAYMIPVSPEDAELMANKPGVSEGQLRYEQYLGRRPFHGEYTIVAEDASETRLDSITIEFNCFTEIDE